MIQILLPSGLSRVRRCCRSTIAALLLAWPTTQVLAGELNGGASGDPQSCLAAIARTERAAQLPPALLHAIAMVESGRFDPQTRVSAPWPWSINVEGVDHVFESKRDAMRAVMVLQASGVQSIDVGCMQINLKFHPQAFATLDEAFDPATNVTYAAAFLWRLRARLGNWPAAAAAYHSQTPTLANAYLVRVATYWRPASGAIIPGAIMPGAVPPPQHRQPPVDPYDVMTIEQKARVAQDATERAARNAAFKDNGLQRPPVARTGGVIMARQQSVLPGLVHATRAPLDQQAELSVSGRWR